jgi:two-component system, cell cycle sensor histidine kinase and response regulator CckA
LPEVLNLSEVIADVLPMLRRLIGADVAITTELLHDLPTIRADRTQVQQVLLNLAVNARDAMPEGGQLTIRTSQTMVEAGADAKRDLAPGQYVVLEVADTGEGLDAAIAERIFEPFFTTKEPGRGTGLGLSTVYGLVRQMGGSITVESERNHGATFTVYLPAATRGRASASTPASSGQEV